MTFVIVHLEPSYFMKDGMETNKNIFLGLDNPVSIYFQDIFHPLHTRSTQSCTMYRIRLLLGRSVFLQTSLILLSIDFENNTVTFRDNFSSILPPYQLYFFGLPLPLVGSVNKIFSKIYFLMVPVIR